MSPSPDRASPASSPGSAVVEWATTLTVAAGTSTSIEGAARRRVAHARQLVVQRRAQHHRAGDRAVGVANGAYDAR